MRRRSYCLWFVVTSFLAIGGGGGYVAYWWMLVWSNHPQFLIQSLGETTTTKKKEKDHHQLLSSESSPHHDLPSICRVTGSSDYTTNYNNRSSSSSSIRNFSDFMIIGNTTTTSEEEGYSYSYYIPVCRIDKIPPHFVHFPHSMQRIYSCISWWYDQQQKQQQADNNNNPSLLSSSSNIIIHPQSRQPVLSLSPEAAHALGYDNNSTKNNNNRYSKGLLKYLQTGMSSGGMNLTIRTVQKESLPFVEPIYKYNQFTFPPQPAYIVQSSNHMQSMRDDIVRQIIPPKPLIIIPKPSSSSSSSKTTTVPRNNNNNNNKCRQTTTNNNNNLLLPVPRIHILNRKGTRSIINVQDLANAIDDNIFHNNNNNNNSNNTTTTTTTTTTMIHYFESASFEEQVKFFHSTDILISPHGAQLTGIPFLSSSYSSSSSSSSEKKLCCRSSILEIFPRRYYIPEFFGSLAYASGIDYGYIYLGYNTTSDMEYTRKNFNLRESIRQKKLCVPIEKILDALSKEIIPKWQQRCNCC